MFTGIVEEIGTIRRVHSGGIEVSVSKVLNGTRLGDSIATNGVCLTVTNMGKDFFTADVMPESFRRSNLGELKKNDCVNLERAMKAGDRFGGHIVSGHIDGTGEIIKMTEENNAVWVKIKTKAQILKYIVEKGSIAIDGISLTVAKVDKESFSVSIIPHTGEETTLLKRKIGYKVNLENDIIGKYVDRLMKFDKETDEAETKNGISIEMLAENGFI